MHPSMTKATCHERMVLKRVDVLGEFKVTMGTRDGLIGLYSKGEDNGYEYAERDDGEKNYCHISLPSIL